MTSGYLQENKKDKKDVNHQACVYGEESKLRKKKGSKKRLVDGVSQANSHINNWWATVIIIKYLKSQDPFCHILYINA